MENQTDSDNVCHQCGAPAALACTHLEQDGTKPVTNYCSKKCQETDWPKHKVACIASRQRQQLHRAGDIIQSFATAYAETAFRFNIATITKTNNEMLKIHQATPKVKQDASHGYDRSLFKGLTEQDHERVVSYFANQCQLKAVFWILKAALKGFRQVRIRVINVGERNELIWLHYASRIDPLTQQMKHYRVSRAPLPTIVITAPLRDGNGYAINVAGAYYGQHRVVGPIDGLLDYGLGLEIKNESLAVMAQEFTNLRIPSPDYAVNDALASMYGEDGISAMVSMSASAYEREKGRLITHFKSSIKTLLGTKKLGDRNKGCAWVGEDYDVCVRVGREECDLLTRSWPGPLTLGFIGVLLERRYGGASRYLIGAFEAAYSFFHTDDDLAEAGFRCLQYGRGSAPISDDEVIGSED